jgi:peptidoglycan/LPS O-acetylase OafA/YrhL
VSRTPARTSTDPEGRFAPLDGLRGVAILMVLWHHLVEFRLPLGHHYLLGWIRAATGLSWAGVDLFFALSGFLIGGILIDNRGSANLTKAFYLRRAARILPLYYATLALVLLAAAIHVPGSFQSFPAWVYFLFLTNVAVGAAAHWDWMPLSVMWSLAVEEQFYLGAPWLIRSLRGSSVPVAAVALAAAAEVLRVGVRLAFPQSALLVHAFTPFRMDSLALGILGSWVARTGEDGSARRWLERRWRAAMGASLAALLCLAALRPAEGSMLMAAAGYAVISISCGLLVTVVSVVRPPAINRFLGMRWLTTLGKLSYFIYLWHTLVPPLLARWLAGPDFVLDSWRAAGVVALSVAPVLAAAWASRKWFEGPIIRWSHRFSY